MQFYLVGGAVRDELLGKSVKDKDYVVVGSTPEEMKAAGYKQALGSSAPHKNLEMITEITGSLPYFQAIVGMEDTKQGKPDPEVFLVAAQRMGVPPQNCLVMEDAVAGIEAATAGGMKSIAITFVGHHSEDSLRAAGANLVVPSLEGITIETINRLLSQS